MAEYRKSKSVNRVFYKIEGDDVVTVTLLEKRMSIDVAVDLWPVRLTATDEDSTVESSEEEFLKAHGDAKAACSMMKII